MFSPSRILMRTFSSALSITLLSEDLPTISNACRIGTPLLSSVASVRVNLATETFCRITPKTGMRSKKEWNMKRPFSVLMNCLNIIKAAMPPAIQNRMV